MARIKDRQKAIELRKQGKTYSEIKRKLGIPKSTLSNWLSRYPLTEKQLKLLEKTVRRNKEIGVERCRLTKQRKRDLRIKSFYEEERKKFIPLSRRELYLAGLFLYWGEGTKGLKFPISLNNTDPKVVKFYLYWLTRILKVPTKKIKVYIHLYSDMDIDKELRFWSRELKIPLKQFVRPYIKQSKRADIDHKGFGHGTCALVVNNVRLKERVMMGIETIADYYSTKI